MSYLCFLGKKAGLLIWNKLLAILNWKNRLPIDCIMAVAEALIAFSISSVAFILMGINYALYTRGAGFGDALAHSANAMLQRPTETVVYVTAILSSTTAYILVRPRILMLHTIPAILALLMAGMLIWMATPLYVSGLMGTPPNMEFASRLAAALAVLATALWLFLLFGQRRLFEGGGHVSGDARGLEIANKIEKS